MGKVSSKFFITTVHDGKTITVSLISNMQLAQYVTSGGSCTPNWNETHPVVYVYSRLSGVVKQPTGLGTWLWNGVAISFDANNKSDIKDADNQSVFERTTVTVGGVSLPALRILRNLGSAQSNTDNDVITYSGSLEIDGVGNAFSVDTVVRISRIAGAGYQATSGGDKIVSSQDTTDPRHTATFFAMLYNDGTVVDSGVKAVFYREGIDPGASETWPKTVTTPEATESTTAFGNTIPVGSYKASIDESEITDRVVIRCDFLKNDASEELLASVWFDIDDTVDDEEMFVVNSTATTSGQSDIQVREGQQVTLKAWMGRTSAQYTRHEEYNEFKCMLTNAQGQVITSGNLIPTGKTVDSKGYFDITKQDVTILDKNGATLLAAGVGGQLTVNADDVDTLAGGGLGGVITAAVVTQV